MLKEHSTQTPPTPSPIRSSLTWETARILREGILTGRWSNPLPGERSLGQQLQISRPTLRRALQIFGKEGLVEINHGHRTKIVRSKNSKVPQPVRKVVALTRLSVHQHPPRLAYVVGEIARYVTAMNLDFVALSDKRTGSQKPQKVLENLVAQNPNCCWVLFGSNAPTQKWFSDKGIPSLLLGSSFTKDILHSIDQDMQATCRHAAGRLLALGHTRLGILIPKVKLAGDVSSIQGVEEAIHLHNGNTNLILLEHDRTLLGQKRVVASMLRTKRRPTALIICGPDSVLTTLPLILGAGVSIPADLSVICRESEKYLESFGIDLTRYCLKEEGLAHKLAQLAIQLSKGSKTQALAQLVEPEYYPGESIAPPKKEYF